MVLPSLLGRSQSPAAIFVIAYLRSVIAMPFTGSVVMPVSEPRVLSHRAPLDAPLVVLAAVSAHYEPERSEHIAHLLDEARGYIAAVWMVGGGVSDQLPNHL